MNGNLHVRQNTQTFCVNLYINANYLLYVQILFISAVAYISKVYEKGQIFSCKDFFSVFFFQSKLHFTT